MPLHTVQEYEIIYKRTETIPESLRESRQIISKKDVAAFAKKFLANTPIEKVIVIALNSQNKIIGFCQTRGTVNQSVLYPREVFSFLFSAGAAAFVLAHNHPGGSDHPSPIDIAITKKLVEAGKLLDLPCIDHVIIFDGGSESIRNHSTIFN